MDGIRDSGPPTTSDLLYASISHRQPAILEYLLEIYPDACIAEDILLGPTYANPDLPTLKVLYDHDPSTIEYRMEHTQGCFTLLMEYCGSGDPLLPSFLLEMGANPNENGLILPIDPLQQATQFGQPLSLILLMIQCHVKIKLFHVLQAIYHKRTDLLDILLHHCQWKFAIYSRCGDKKVVRRAARDQSNDKVIVIVENYMRNQKKIRKWWQYLVGKFNGQHPSQPTMMRFATP